MTAGKTIALSRLTFVSKVMSLLFNMLSRLVIAFLSSSKHLLISWLQSPFSVILEPKKIKSVTVSPCMKCMWLDAMMLVFWILSFKPTFSLSCFSFIKRPFSSSSLSSSCCARIKMQFFFLVHTQVLQECLALLRILLFSYPVSDSLNGPVRSWRKDEPKVWRKHFILQFPSGTFISEPPPRSL